MYDYRNEQLSADERAELILKEMTVEEKVSQLTNSSAAVERIGINSYNWWNEALHGVARAGTATVFPQAIGMAASWNPDLLYKTAVCISDEARAKYNKYKAENDYRQYHGLTFWSPNINIFRDPRWGRGQETYGEDPYLTSSLGTAFIRGLQGDDKKILKTAACAKHFAVHSGPESSRQGYNVNISEKDLRETYLPAFKTCVQTAGVETVMGAYNAIDSVPCCCNGRFLTDILRKEWHFGGHVVSDCGAIHNISKYHKFAQDDKDASAKALKAGCDLNCGTAYEALIQAYEEDMVTEEDIDTALKRLLRTRIKLGMFDKKTPYDGIDYSVVASPAHKEICLEMTRQSIVMLKNDGLLPLRDKNIKVAVIGPNGDSKEVLLGNYNGIPTQYSTVYKGLCDYLGEENVRYAKGSDRFGYNGEDVNNAMETAKECDIVLMCLGLTAKFEGEGGDAFNPYSGGDRPDIEIFQSQKAVFDKIYSANKNIILLMFAGGAVSFGDTKSKARAIFNCWYPGELGGKAIAQTIFGDYSPSGKLPVTFYTNTSDIPDFDDYSMKGRTYRYFGGKPDYEFGFGLTYTSFIYNDIIKKKISDNTEISVTVKNSGRYDAYETLELFRTEKNRECNQPIRTLTAFKKVFIKKDESARVTFNLPPESFSKFSDAGEEIILPENDFELFFMSNSEKYDCI